MKVIPHWIEPTIAGAGVATGDGAEQSVGVTVAAEAVARVAD
jgi:hypothetical protein